MLRSNRDRMQFPAIHLLPQLVGNLVLKPEISCNSVTPVYDFAPVMSAVPESLELNLQSTYGALLIGCFFSVAVWGVSLVQTILYFMMYENDSWKLKFMILFLIAVDTANEILLLRSVWPALILHWGRADILVKSEGTIELIHHVWVAALVAAAVQSYYTWRIYTFSGQKRLVPFLLIPLISWQILGLGPYNFLVFGHATVSAGKQTRQLTAVAISIRATGAATDIFIAGAMIYLLNQPYAHIPSMSSKTRKLLSRIIILSINSGAWTAILAVLDFIFIVAFPVDFTFCIVELPLCSVYLSTLLLNLNVRKFIDPVETTIGLTDITWTGNARSESGETIPPQGLSAGPVYSSQADSGLSTLQKLTRTLPEDIHMSKSVV
ncbi:hypothetical protein MSAN_02092100 [Mycena sanguinolenta]|uniref:DUF6534 domain-containing protein n=1 Tax=Mycena sanguinolenta TaxID=230812 RepID=A0A8H6XIN9_9AGAR|nr:hypothetical protein MSAN_02092100 [Mycena sanguinolenta]